VIGSVNEALHHFIRYLRARGFEVLKAKPTNFMRHYLIEARHWSIPGRTVRYYLVYQREWLLSMPALFPDADAPGATVNREVLEECLKAGVSLIVFAHPTGYYGIEPGEMKRLAEEHGWVRTSRKTGEETVHVPVTRLRPIPVLQLVRTG